MSGARFHLSYRSDDAAVARRFFVEVVGCAVSRDGGGWFDIDFFGHQLTIHAGGNAREPIGPGQRLDHFGAVLDRAAWLALLQRFEQAGAPFRLKPTPDAFEAHAARGKFVIDGPDGVGLEFKFDR